MKALYLGFRVKMNNTHSPLNNIFTMTSHQITQLMNTDILILNLMIVHQRIIDNIDELLMIDD